MKETFIQSLLILASLIGFGQDIGPYTVTGVLESAVHPNGCDDSHVIGMPDETTWVNFWGGEVMTGVFEESWVDGPGDDLVLETSYHEDNMDVRLELSTGAYSDMASVTVDDWDNIPNVFWTHLFGGCNEGSSNSSRWITALDFANDFNLGPADVVVGIEITFLEAPGATDLAGVYIIQDTECPTLDLGADVFECEGWTGTFDATTPGATYEWHDGSTNATFEASTSGTYEVTVTTAQCAMIDAVDVTITPLPDVDLGPDQEECEGTLVLLDATTPDGLYSWSNNSTLSALEVSQPGDYWVEVWVNGCMSSDTVNVDFLPAPSIDFPDEISLCNIESHMLDATFSGATYEWDSGETTPTLEVTISGDYGVTLSIDQCQASDEVLVLLNTSTEFDLGPDLTLCPDESHVLSAPAGGLSYEWNDGSFGQTMTIEEEGTFWLEVDNGWCLSQDTVIVDYIELELDLGEDHTTCFPYLTLDAGNPGASFEWQDGTNSQTFEVNEIGTYSVTVTFPEGCQVSDDIVIESDQISVHLEADNFYCFDGMATVLASSPDAITHWNTGVSGDTIYFDQSGWYHVTGEVGICTHSDSMYIEIGEPIADFDASSTSGCPDLFTSFSDLSSSGDYAIVSWQWSFGDGGFSSDQDPLHSFDGNGTHNVTLEISDINGCHAISSQGVDIEEYSLPIPYFWSEPEIGTIGEPIQFINHSDNSLEYFWEFGNGESSSLDEPSTTYLEPGDYPILLIAVNEHCADSVLLYLHVNDIMSYYIPNSFTPNADGFNEYFQPVFNPDFQPQLYRFLIFNRWGEIVFETNDFTQGWSGNVKSGQHYAQDGTYVWRIEFEDANSVEIFEDSGTVTIFR